MTAMRLPLSDAELAAALTPSPAVVAPAGIAELIAADIRAAKQRRLNALRWPRQLAPTYPDQRNRWTLVLAAALLTLAVVTAAVAASRLLDRSLPHGNGDIYVQFRGGFTVISPDGISLTRREFPGLDNPSAAWSPRGDVIAYWGPSRDHRSHVILARADGTIVTRVEPGDAGLPPKTIPGGVSWSPDASSLILDGDIQGVTHMFRIDLAQPRFVDITPQPTYGRSPVWSSRGDVAFIPFDQSQWGRRPWIMSATGAGAHPLTVELPDDMRVDGITWTPDGERLVIQASNGENRIYVVDRDGSRLTRMVSALQYPFVAALSPDGRKMLLGNWIGAIGDETQVYLADTDDDGLTMLMRNAGPLGYSPDGQMILVVTPACGWIEGALNSCDQSIQAIDPTTGEAQDFVSSSQMDSFGDSNDHGGIGYSIWRAKDAAGKTKPKLPNVAH